MHPKCSAHVTVLIHVCVEPDSTEPTFGAASTPTLPTQRQLIDEESRTLLTTIEGVSIIIPRPREGE